MIPSSPTSGNAVPPGASEGVRVRSEELASSSPATRSAGTHVAPRPAFSASDTPPEPDALHARGSHHSHLTGTFQRDSGPHSAPIPVEKQSKTEQLRVASELLLNKLMLRRKASPSSITLEAGTARDSSLSGSMPDGQSAAPKHGFLNSDESEVEELQASISRPGSNPLAPLLNRVLTTTMNMKGKATAAAMAGMKRPWQRRSPATAAAPLSTQDLTPLRIHSSGKWPRSSQGAVATTLRTETSPPMGYLWIWMGSFQRWQRRFIVASEAPGVLLIYKRMNMKGKVVSISLRNVDVQEDDSDPRQLKIVTATGFIFLRSILVDERAQWLACLRDSVTQYRASQGLVEQLKDQGRLPQPTAQDLGRSSQHPHLPAPFSSRGLPEVAEMDWEQRRRIRARMTDRLSELAPFQQEVERHMNVLSSQLLTVVSSLNIRLPSMASSNSMNRISSLISVNPQGTRPSRSVSTSQWGLPVQVDQQPVTVEEQTRDGFAPPLNTESSFHRDLGAPSQPAPTGCVVADAGVAQKLLKDDLARPPQSIDPPPLKRGVPQYPGTTAVPETVSEPGRRNSVMNTRLKPQGPKCANLQQAYAQLLEAFRNGLYTQTVRIAQLEVENLALHSAVSQVKQQQERAERERSRMLPRDIGSGARGPSVTGLDTEHASDVLSDESSSDMGDVDAASVITADEDAFDIEESFDEGVPYDILDDPDAPNFEEEHTATSFGVDVSEPYPGTPSPARSLALRQGLQGTANAHSPSHTGGIRARAEAGMETDTELDTQEAQVHHALEVVRQVEYVERHNPQSTISVNEPPDNKPSDRMPTSQDEDESDDNGDEQEHRTQGAPRERLPAPRALGKGFSIWELLRNMIGKDLTRLTMPATINEPTSTLQRLAETLEHAALLDRCAAETRSVDRLLLVSVFNLTCYNSQALRDGKPFNPLLGETYEWRNEDGTLRYVCEQVSHHPPVLAYVATSSTAGWEMQGELETKSKFWGKSVDILLHGTEGMRFPEHGDCFRWNRPTISIQDLLLGNYWTEVTGAIKVTNSTTGEVARLNLKPCRRRMADRGVCEGVVCDAKGSEVWRITGSTADRIFAQLTPAAALARGLTAPEPQLMWTKPPYPSDAAEQYWFTQFAIGLNDPADRICSLLPPTDARFRPDQRALEVGEWSRATSEKLRLEEKQRGTRRERAKRGEGPWRPLWFKQTESSVLTRAPGESGFAWDFTGQYWEHQQAKDWSACPDLYSV